MNKSLGDRRLHRRVERRLTLVGEKNSLRTVVPLAEAALVLLLLTLLLGVPLLLAGVNLGQ